jgi:hypothetical protein
MSQHSSGSGRKRGNMGKGPNRPAPATPPKMPANTAAEAAETAAPKAAAESVASAAPVAVAEKPAPAPEPAAAVEAPASVNPVDAENDAMVERFEQAQKRYGPAYAAMSEGLRGEGIDKLVKYVQYGLAAAAVFVVVAAVFAA